MEIYIAASIRAAVQVQMEMDCQAVCGFCKVMPYNGIGYPGPDGFSWYHEWGGKYFKCDAEHIRQSYAEYQLGKSKK